MIPDISWTEVSGWGLAVLLIFALMAGKVIPRGTMNEILQGYKDLLVTKDKTISILEANNNKLLGLTDNTNTVMTTVASSVAQRGDVDA